MSNYRGLEGFLAIGGVLSGTGAPPKLNGALTVGNTTMNIDGNGAQLIGVVVAGDTFTIAGEAGSPTHTVTGGSFYVAAVNAIAGITFTPGIAAGGAADNAVVTFASNAIAEAKAHTLNVTLQVLETTHFQDRWRTIKGGLAQWVGTGTAQLDTGDARQATNMQATPNLVVNGVLFGLQLATTLLKQLYGGVVLSGFTITADKGAIVEVAFNFEGTGTILPNWT
jgi:hypothetical protein